MAMQSSSSPTDIVPRPKLIGPLGESALQPRSTWHHGDDIDLDEHAFERQGWHRRQRPCRLPIAPNRAEFLLYDPELLLVVIDNVKRELRHVGQLGTGCRQHDFSISHGLLELRAKVTRKDLVLGFAALSGRKNHSPICRKDSQMRIAVRSRIVETLRVDETEVVHISSAIILGHFTLLFCCLRASQPRGDRSLTFRCRYGSSGVQARPLFW